MAASTRPVRRDSLRSAMAEDRITEVVTVPVSAERAFGFASQRVDLAPWRAPMSS